MLVRSLPYGSHVITHYNELMECVIKTMTDKQTSFAINRSSKPYQENVFKGNIFFVVLLHRYAVSLDLNTEQVLTHCQ